MNQKKPIPEEVALQLCEEVRKLNKKKKLSLAKGQCWGCMRYSQKKNDIRHRCIFGEENNRGCHLINKMFDEKY